MEWISGIKRNLEGRLWIEKQDQKGGKALVSPGIFSSDLSIEGERGIRACIGLGKGKRVPTSDYLNAIGAPNLDARGQKTYVFSDAKHSIVLPAQLLVFEIIATLNTVKQLILTPSSPRQVVTVFRGNDETLEMRPSHQGQQRLAISQLERLAWMQQYPSTQAFWSSVYLSALKGQLSPQLPKASLTAQLRGKFVGRTLYVTRIVSAHLAADEPPFESFGNAATRRITR